MGAGCKRGNTKGPTSLLQNSLPTCDQFSSLCFDDKMFGLDTII